MINAVISNSDGEEDEREEEKSPSHFLQFISYFTMVIL